MNRDEIERDLRELAQAFRASRPEGERFQFQLFEAYVRERRPDIDRHVRKRYRTYPYKMYEVWLHELR